MRTFSFAAISPAIFARSDELGYSQVLTLHQPIPFSADTWSAGPGEIISGPLFFFRPCIDGYQFGLRVHSRLWEAPRHQFAAALRDRALNPSNELVSGLLPYGSGAYPPMEPVSLWYGFGWKQRRWKRALQQEERTLDDDYPTRIYHRYVGVRYSDI